MVNIDKEVKKLVKPGDYCRFLGRNLEAHGIKDKDIVYVASSMVVPTDPKDLYTQRVHFSIHATNEENIPIIPDTYFVDPKNLRKVGQKLMKSLEGNLEKALNNSKEVTGNATIN